MGWKRMDVREQRVEFAVSAVRGDKPVSALCAEYGISRPTGYLWLKRYRESGRVPHVSPLRRGFAGCQNRHSLAP
jgi:transposase-like protein